MDITCPNNYCYDHPHMYDKPGVKPCKTPNCGRLNCKRLPCKYDGYDLGLGKWPKNHWLYALCISNGMLYPNKINHPKIRHHHLHPRKSLHPLRLKRSYTPLMPPLQTMTLRLPSSDNIFWPLKMKLKWIDPNMICPSLIFLLWNVLTLMAPCS